MVLGCKSGVAPSGSDGVECTTDVCNEDTDAFDHTPDDSVCDDQKPCNGTELCDVDDGCTSGSGVVVSRVFTSTFAMSSFTSWFEISAFQSAFRICCAIGPFMLLGRRLFTWE